MNEGSRGLKHEESHYMERFLILEPSDACKSSKNTDKPLTSTPPSQPFDSNQTRLFTPDELRARGEANANFRARNEINQQKIEMKKTILIT